MNKKSPHPLTVLSRIEKNMSACRCCCARMREDQKELRRVIEVLEPLLPDVMPKRK